MNTITMKPNSISPDRFTGNANATFNVVERTSLTVHLEDAGWFDVMAWDGDEAIWAGRYSNFADAHDVASGLNRVWLTVPDASPREVLAFVGRNAWQSARVLLDQHGGVMAVRALRDQFNERVWPGTGRGIGDVVKELEVSSDEDAHFLLDRFAHLLERAASPAK